VQAQQVPFITTTKSPTSLNGSGGRESGSLGRPSDVGADVRPTRAEKNRLSLTFLKRHSILTADKDVRGKENYSPSHSDNGDAAAGAPERQHYRNNSTKISLASPKQQHTTIIPAVADNGKRDHSASAQSQTSGKDGHSLRPPSHRLSFLHSESSSSAPSRSERGGSVDDRTNSGASGDDIQRSGSSGFGGSVRKRLSVLGIGKRPSKGNVKSPGGISEE
jgi:hypothetical protein